MIHPLMKWHSMGSLISNLAQTVMSYCQLAIDDPSVTSELSAPPEKKQM